MSLVKWHVLESHWRALAYVSLMEWYVLETWWHALAYVACTGDVVVFSLSLMEWYVLETWWRALAYMAFVKWYILETWCSCIHVTCEVTYTGDLVLLHTCHLWSGMYWRHGALAYMSLVKWHVLKMWCSCIHVTCEVTRTRDLVIYIHVTCEVTYTRNLVLLHTYHLWSGTYWRLSARMRAHQGRSLGLKSLGAATMDVPILKRKLWKGRKDVDFYSMYLLSTNSLRYPRCASLNPFKPKPWFFSFWDKRLE